MYRAKEIKTLTAKGKSADIAVQSYVRTYRISNIGSKVMSNE